jgi:uncharacterized pyridoxamine 5'-phosphate oxidase family protein
LTNAAKIIGGVLRQALMLANNKVTFLSGNTKQKFQRAKITIRYPDIIFLNSW